MLIALESFCVSIHEQPDLFVDAVISNILISTKDESHVSASAIELDSPPSKILHLSSVGVELVDRSSTNDGKSNFLRQLPPSSPWTRKHHHHQQQHQHQRQQQHSDTKSKSKSASTSTSTSLSVLIAPLRITLTPKNLSMVQTCLVENFKGKQVKSEPVVFNSQSSCFFNLQLDKLVVELVTCRPSPTSRGLPPTLFESMPDRFGDFGKNNHAPNQMFDGSDFECNANKNSGNSVLRLELKKVQLAVASVGCEETISASLRIDQYQFVGFGENVLLGSRYGDLQTELRLNVLFNNVEGKRKLFVDVKFPSSQLIILPSVILAVKGYFGSCERAPSTNNTNSNNSNTTPDTAVSNLPMCADEFKVDVTFDLFHLILPCEEVARSASNTNPSTTPTGSLPIPNPIPNIPISSQPPVQHFEALEISWDSSMQLEISAKSSPENSNYSVDVDDFVRDKFSPTNTNANINMNEIKPIQVWDEFCRKMDDERPEINPPQTILLNKMKLAVTDVEVNIVKIKVDDGRIVKSGVKFDNSDDASKSDGDDFDHVNINSDSDGQLDATIIEGIDEENENEMQMRNAAHPIEILNKFIKINLPDGDQTVVKRFSFRVIHTSVLSSFWLAGKTIKAFHHHLDSKLDKIDVHHYVKSDFFGKVLRCSVQPIFKNGEGSGKSGGGMTTNANANPIAMQSMSSASSLSSMATQVKLPGTLQGAPPPVNMSSSVPNNSLLSYSDSYSNNDDSTLLDSYSQRGSGRGGLQDGRNSLAGERILNENERTNNSNGNVNSNSNKWVQLFKKSSFFVNVEMDGVQIIVIPGARIENRAPIFKLSLNKINSGATFTNLMNGLPAVVAANTNSSNFGIRNLILSGWLDCELGSEYLNRNIASWEPLVEPWGVHFDYGVNFDKVRRRLPKVERIREEEDVDLFKGSGGVGGGGGGGGRTESSENEEKVGSRQMIELGRRVSNALHFSPEPTVGGGSHEGNSKSNSKINSKSSSSNHAANNNNININNPTTPANNSAASSSPNSPFSSPHANLRHLNLNFGLLGSSSKAPQSSSFEVVRTASDFSFLLLHLISRNLGGKSVKQQTNKSTFDFVALAVAHRMKNRRDLLNYYGISPSVGEEGGNNSPAILIKLEDDKPLNVNITSAFLEQVVAQQQERKLIQTTPAVVAQQRHHIIQNKSGLPLNYWLDKVSGGGAKSKTGSVSSGNLACLLNEEGAPDHEVFSLTYDGVGKLALPNDHLYAGVDNVDGGGGGGGGGGIVNDDEVVDEATNDVNRFFIAIEFLKKSKHSRQNSKKSFKLIRRVPVDRVGVFEFHLRRMNDNNDGDNVVLVRVELLGDSKVSELK